MPQLNSDQWLTVIITALGVFGTIVISIVGLYWGPKFAERESAKREQRKAWQQGQDVRTILRTEININTDLVRQMWNQVRNGRNLQIAPGEELYAAARRFAYEQRLRFPRHVYVSQLPLISSALHGSEQIRVIEFYNDLSKIESAQELLLAAAENARLGHTPEDEFQNRAAVMIPQIDRLAYHIDQDIIII